VSGGPVSTSEGLARPSGSASKRVFQHLAAESHPRPELLVGRAAADVPAKANASVLFVLPERRVAVSKRIGHDRRGHRSDELVQSRVLCGEDIYPERVELCLELFARDVATRPHAGEEVRVFRGRTRAGSRSRRQMQSDNSVEW